ncbi:MAG TPA: iron-sulfur cluster assembly protein [Amycolatopsis sp.]|nr:iron-sulfur cluster assembly protein [Amycolatopsis sp.]
MNATKITGLPQLIDERLRQIIDPCSVGVADPMNIVEMGLIKSVDIEDGHVRIEMCLTSPTCMMLEHFVGEARRLLGSLPGVRDVDVRGDIGLDWTPDRIDENARRRRQLHLDRLEARSDRRGGQTS